ncbi:MAG: protein-ADP-ribose hydrolase [Lachnospiraceae bacterium]|nr:protein-ADP-ribose hydrolase [Lachnospiraceae bacterium]
MTQDQRRIYLIKQLLAENVKYKSMKIPSDINHQKELLRTLMNERNPAPISKEFIEVQDEYLKTAIAEKGITKLGDLKPVINDIYLWQGDITTLECDAIVNAANTQMLGCFRAMHNCIDNCIHTFAGVQLRNKCNEIMKKQGHNEPSGRAKITPAFNLPCRYVIHTVGPVINSFVREEHRKTLASCYKSCLELADKNNCKSIAFCCISTGVFGFPQYEAAKIALKAVTEYKKNHKRDIKVIFDVYKYEDLMIYEELFEEKKLLAHLTELVEE